MGMSFWDEILSVLLPRYRQIVGVDKATEWASHSATAKGLRSAYEDAIKDAMRQYSEHPIKPITELEVFIGYIVNRTGVQTHRQRDRSIKLKDEFDRVASWISGQMRGTRQHNNTDVPLTGYQTEFDKLNLCLACVYVGLDKEHSQETAREGYGKMESFRIVALSAFVAELTYFENGYGKPRGGGFVGVGGGGGGHAATRKYSEVPPPKGL